MGDALAVAVLEARGFTAQDFARSHPGGALGRKLLLHVGDLMRTGEAVPRVGPEAPLSEGLLEMSRKGLGMTAVVDRADAILGVFTDGDLRRALDKQIDVHATVMRAVMTRHGKTIGPQELAATAVHLMEVHRITALPVVDGNGRLVGALNVHDLMRAGVV
jgi:arabinose-5-phosphate isomerase